MQSTEFLVIKVSKPGWKSLSILNKNKLMVGRVYIHFEETKAKKIKKKNNVKYPLKFNSEYTTIAKDVVILSEF